jgi:hypothetical protein
MAAEVHGARRRPSFAGAQLLNQITIQPVTQPIVRLDLDRMDDNDNRLFGITAQIAWMPKTVLPADAAHAALRRPQLTAGMVDDR